MRRAGRRRGPGLTARCQAAQKLTGGQARPCFANFLVYSLDTLPRPAHQRAVVRRRGARPLSSASRARPGGRHSEENTSADPKDPLLLPGQHRPRQAHHVRHHALGGAGAPWPAVRAAHVPALPPHRARMGNPRNAPRPRPGKVTRAAAIRHLAIPGGGRPGIGQSRCGAPLRIEAHAYSTTPHAPICDACAIHLHRARHAR